MGRFLEHSRIYYFSGNDHEEIYLASADMMTRNLNRRVEELFPVTEDDTKARAISILHEMWHDNTKAWRLVGNHYVKMHPDGQKPVNSQQFFMDEATALRKKEKHERKNKKHFSNVFETLTKHVSGLLLNKTATNEKE